MSRTPESTDEQEVTVEKSTKQITLGVIANFLFNYGILPINIILTFTLQNFSIEIRAILILSLVFTQSAQIILLYIPPSIGTVMTVKIPEYVSKGQHSVVKGIIRYVFIIKIIASSLTALIYAIIGFTLFRTGETFEVTAKGICLLILSPYIIIEELRRIGVFIFQSLKKFMIRVYIFAIQRVILLIGYIVVFYGLNLPENIDLYIIVTLNVVCVIPSAIIYFILYLRKYQNVETQRITWKNIKDTVKHGLSFTVISSIDLTTTLVNNTILDGNDNEELVVRYSLANNLVIQSFKAFSIPLTPIFVDLNVSEKQKEMRALFKKSSYFMNILLAFLVGLLFSLSEIYVAILYQDSFLDFVPFLRIFILTIYFENWISNYNSYYAATHKEKRMVVIKLITFGFILIFTIISYLIWNIYGMMITLILGKLLQVFLYWADEKFNLKGLKMTLWEIFQQLVIVLGILFLNYLLFLLIDLILPLEGITTWIFKITSLLRFDLVETTVMVNNGIQIFTFIVLFTVYVIFFRAITKQDLQTLENAKLKIPFKKLLKKILKDKRYNGFVLPV